MTAPFYTDKIKYFSKNTRGNDYVVGDIHGRYDLVAKALDKVKFNTGADRLFCVGDLIDRGNQSAYVLEFLQQPYVHAIRGNHEDMLLELYANEQEPSQEKLKEYAEGIGLNWWLSVSDENKKDILDLLRQLPIIAEICTERGNVGLVHGDVPIGFGWEQFKDLILQEHPRVVAEAMWGRTRLSYGVEEEVKGIGRVYVGHTVQPKIRKLANVVAIDTGAVYNEHLTLVNIECKTQAILRAKRPFGDIQVINPVEKTAIPFGGYFDFLT